MPGSRPRTQVLPDVLSSSPARSLTRIVAAEASRRFLQNVATRTHSSVGHEHTDLSAPQLSSTFWSVRMNRGPIALSPHPHAYRTHRAEHDRPHDSAASAPSSRVVVDCRQAPRNSGNPVDWRVHQRDTRHFTLLLQAPIGAEKHCSSFPSSWRANTGQFASARAAGRNDTHCAERAPSRCQHYTPIPREGELQCRKNSTSGRHIRCRQSSCTLDQPVGSTPMGRLGTQCWAWASATTASRCSSTSGTLIV